MSDPQDDFESPTHIVTEKTPTFIITLLAFQPDNQDHPRDINTLCETLARQENLLAAYGLIVAGAKVSSISAEGAGAYFADGNEVKLTSPLN